MDAAGAGGRRLRGAPVRLRARRGEWRDVARVVRQSGWWRSEDRDAARRWRCGGARPSLRTPRAARFERPDPIPMPQVEVVRRPARWPGTTVDPPLPPRSCASSDLPVVAMQVLTIIRPGSDPAQHLQCWHLIGANAPKAGTDYKRDFLRAMIQDRAAQTRPRSLHSRPRACLRRTSAMGRPRRTSASTRSATGSTRTGAPDV